MVRTEEHASSISFHETYHRFKFYLSTWSPQRDQGPWSRSSQCLLHQIDLSFWAGVSGDRTRSRTYKRYCNRGLIDITCCPESLLLDQGISFVFHFYQHTLSLLAQGMLLVALQGTRGTVFYECSSVFMPGWHLRLEGITKDRSEEMNLGIWNC